MNWKGKENLLLIPCMIGIVGSLTIVLGAMNIPSGILIFGILFGTLGVGSSLLWMIAHGMKMLDDVARDWKSTKMLRLNVKPGQVLFVRVKDDLREDVIDRVCTIFEEYSKRWGIECVVFNGECVKEIKVMEKEDNTVVL